MEAWSADLERLAGLGAFPALAHFEESMRRTGFAALPKMQLPKLVSDEVLAAASRAVDMSHITAGLGAFPALAQFEESMRRTGFAALPKMQLPKLVSDEVLAAASRAVDMSHITAGLGASPALAQLEESMRRTGFAALPKMQLPKLVSDEVLAAASRAVDMSHIMAGLGASPAFRELGTAFSQYILRGAPFEASVSASLTMRTIFDELSAVSSGLVDVEDDALLPSVLEGSSGLANGQDIAIHASVLLVVVLACAVATVPGAEASVVAYGRALLEEGAFIGRMTHDAYLTLSEAVPDDNVLGWAAMLGWLLRWMKGTGGDSGSGAS